MGYSDLPEEKVKSIIEEIKDTELFVDLILMQNDMIQKGKINNDAFRFLQKEIEERREKTRGSK